MGNNENCCGNNHSNHLTTETTISNAKLSHENLIETVFEVSGMDCADEVTAIQAALRHDQIADVHANLMASTVRIRHLPSIGASILKAKVESAGVKVKNGLAAEKHSLSQTRLVLVALSGFCVGAGLVIGYLTDGKWGPLKIDKKK